MLQALNWAGCLEETLRQQNDPLLGAVRFAMDSVVHQWADGVEGRNVPFPIAVKARGTGAGRVSGPIAPPVVWEWFWRDRTQLPPTPPRHQHRHWQQNVRHYDTLLANKPVREALEALRGKF